MKRIIFDSGEVGLTNSTHKLKDGINMILFYLFKQTKLTKEKRKNV